MSTSGLTLEEMKTALERYGFNAEDPLTTWLNASLHQIESMMDWPWLYQPPVTVTGKAGDRTITLPNAALMVVGIKDTVNNYKLKYYDRHKFMRLIWENTEVGLPQVYTLIGTQEVEIWRELEKEIPFEVLYQGMSNNLVNATDVPTCGSHVWPTMAHYPIVQLAASIALQAESEEDRAKTAQSEADKALTALMARFASPHRDEPRTVEDAQGYQSDYAPSRWSQL